MLGMMFSELWCVHYLLKYLDLLAGQVHRLSKMLFCCNGDVWCFPSGLFPNHESSLVPESHQSPPEPLPTELQTLWWQWHTVSGEQISLSVPLLKNKTRLVTNTNGTNMNLQVSTQPCFFFVFSIMKQELYYIHQINRIRKGLLFNKSKGLGDLCFMRELVVITLLIVYVIFVLTIV